MGGAVAPGRQAGDAGLYTWARVVSRVYAWAGDVWTFSRLGGWTFSRLGGWTVEWW